MCVILYSSDGSNASLKQDFASAGRLYSGGDSEVMELTTCVGGFEETGTALEVDSLILSPVQEQENHFMCGDRAMANATRLFSADNDSALMEMTACVGRLDADSTVAEPDLLEREDGGAWEAGLVDPHNKSAFLEDEVVPGGAISSRVAANGSVVCSGHFPIAGSTLNQTVLFGDDDNGMEMTQCLPRDVSVSVPSLSGRRPFGKRADVHRERGVRFLEEAAAVEEGLRPFTEVGDVDISAKVDTAAFLRKLDMTESSRKAVEEGIRPFAEVGDVDISVKVDTATFLRELDMVESSRKAVGDDVRSCGVPLTKDFLGGALNSTQFLTRTTLRNASSELSVTEDRRTETGENGADVRSSFFGVSGGPLGSTHSPSLMSVYASSADSGDVSARLEHSHPTILDSQSPEFPATGISYEDSEISFRNPVLVRSGADSSDTVQPESRRGLDSTVSATLAVSVNDGVSSLVKSDVSMQLSARHPEPSSETSAIPQGVAVCLEPSVGKETDTPFEKSDVHPAMLSFRPEVCPEMEATQFAAKYVASSIVMSPLPRRLGSRPDPEVSCFPEEVAVESNWKESTASIDSSRLTSALPATSDFCPVPNLPSFHAEIASETDGNQSIGCAASSTVMPPLSATFDVRPDPSLSSFHAEFAPKVDGIQSSGYVASNSVVSPLPVKTDVCPELHVSSCLRTEFDSEANKNQSALFAGSVRVSSPLPPKPNSSFCTEFAAESDAKKSVASRSMMMPVSFCSSIVVDGVGCEECRLEQPPSAEVDLSALLAEPLRADNVSVAEMVGFGAAAVENLFSSKEQAPVAETCAATVVDISYTTSGTESDKGSHETRHAVAAAYLPVLETPQHNVESSANSTAPNPSTSKTRKYFEHADDLLMRVKLANSMPYHLNTSIRNSQWPVFSAVKQVNMSAVRPVDKSFSARRHVPAASPFQPYKRDLERPKELGRLTDLSGSALGISGNSSRMEISAVQPVEVTETFPSNVVSLSLAESLGVSRWDETSANLDSIPTEKSLHTESQLASSFGGGGAVEELTDGNTQPSAGMFVLWLDRRRDATFFCNFWKQCMCREICRWSSKVSENIKTRNIDVGVVP